MSDSLLHRFTCVISKSFFARGIVRERPTLPAWDGLELLEQRLLLSTDSNPIAFGSPPSIPGGSVYIGPVPDYSPLADSIAIPILPEPEDAVWLPSGVVPMMPPPPPPTPPTLYWDPDHTVSGNNTTSGAGLGGPGNWNLTDYFWYNPATGQDVQWSNSNNATAVFFGGEDPPPPWTVNLTTGITAGAIRFRTAGYTVASNTLTLTCSGSVETWVDGTIASVIAGSAGLRKSCSYTLTVTGASTYSCGTTIAAGTLALGGGNNRLPTGTTVTLGNSIDNGTLKLNGYTQELAGLAISGTGSSNRVVNDSATAGALTLNSSSSYTVSAILGGSSADEKRFGLTKKGSGTLTLSGANSYTCGTAIQAGTLVLGGSSALPTGTMVTLGNPCDSATLKLNGYSLEVNGLTTCGTGGSNRVINGSYTSATLTVNTGSSTCYGGVLGGSGYDGNLGLTKTGSGTLTLSSCSCSCNSYTGATTISGGVLRAPLGSALPSSSGLVFDGGVWEGSCTFARSLGTGGGNVRWLGDGGFSAFGGQLTVAIGGTCNPTELTWGGTNFVQTDDALLFGSAASDNQVLFVNNINMGAATRTVNVADNSSCSSDSAEVSGVLSGNSAGLIKSGSGTLTLSSCSNSYTGATTISGGVLRAGLGTGLPDASNLVFSGGVLETSGTFERSLGDGADEVRWTGDGGFSAFGGQLTVAIGGTCNLTELTWGGTYFVPDGSQLLFGSAASDNRVLFVNDINMLAAGMVAVKDNPNSSCDRAELSGELDWTYGLTKAGDGKLVLSGTVTVGPYSGTALTISEGTLQLDTPITSTDPVRINPGGQLTGSAPVYGNVIRYVSTCTCNWEEIVCGCATNNGDCSSFSGSSDLPGLTRVFASKGQYAPDMGLGPNWIIREWPSIITPPYTNQHVVVKGGAPREWFDGSTARHGTLDTLDSDEEGFVLTDPQGNVTRFLSDSGRFKSFADPAGNTTEATYDDGKLVEVNLTFSADEDEQDITSLTCLNHTATATVANHGYNTGDYVQVSGADQAEYNGRFTITKVDDNTFTYTVSGSPVTPATGTIEVKKLGTHDYYTLTYTGDRITLVVLSRVVNGHDFTNIRQVAYAYYGDQEGFGNEGDLKTAVISDSSGTIDTKYYRYYKPGDCTVTEGGVDVLKGYPHTLRFALEGDAYARLQASGGSTASADSALLSFATVYNEYDGEHRLAKAVRAAEGCSVCGGTGQGTYTYSYIRSDNPEGYNSWRYETVMDLPASVGQQITYYNKAGQVMLEVFAASGQQWCTFHRYDVNGREDLTADAAAVTGFDPYCADLLNEVDGNYTYLSDNAGLITVTDYYPTGGSQPAGYYHTTSIKHGETDTNPILQEHVDYIAHTVNLKSIYPVNSFSVYDDTGGETTSYSYTWFPDGFQMESQQTIYPEVSIDRNGSGENDSTTTFFDPFDRPIWTKDAEGYINHFEYDAATGAVVKTIVDVDYDFLPEGEQGFLDDTAQWQHHETGLHLITTYEVDPLGRTTKVTDPNGNVTYTVYKDAVSELIHIGDNTATILREVRTYPGWTAENTTTGPIQIHREVVFDYSEYEGDSRWAYFTEDLTVAVAPYVDDGQPTGNEPFVAGNIRSLSRSYVNVSGQVVTSDSYYSTTAAEMTYSLEPDVGSASDNYLRTTYAYCVRGWVNRTVYPDGTIERTVYHPIGRVVSQWVGTDDTPDSGTWSPTNNAGANMVETVCYFYDQATPGSGDSGVGDGNVTETRTLYGDGSGEYYKTVYRYDWRNRLTDARGPDNVATETTYNNLGEVTLVETYADADTDFVIDSGELRGKVEHAYDELGRVYRTLTYEVDPETGDVGDHLTSNVWYNKRGMVMKTADPNGLFSKAAYDGAGRLVSTYTSFDADESGYTEAQGVSGDTVIEQTKYHYDDAGNIWLRRDFQRLEDANGTGELSAPAQPKARVTYTAAWFDPLGRTTTTIFYGTNDGAVIDSKDSDFDPETNGTQEYGDSGVPPGPDTSDKYIVTQYVYNEEQSYTATIDNKLHEARTVYDLLGRTTRTIANYDDGEVLATEDAAKDQTTEYTYDSAGRLIALTALDPKGSGNGVQHQETRYLYTSDIDRSWATHVLYPDSSADTSGTSVSVTDLVQTGGTATATTDGAHGYDVGDTVHITGASPDAYNGWFVITSVPSTTTFTYTVDASATSPASGTKTARKLGTDEVKTTYDRLGRKLTVTDQRGVVHTYTYDTAGRLASDAATTVPSGVDSSVRCISYRYYGTEQTVTTAPTRDGSTVTVTLADHGYTTGNQVQISGAEQAAYNGSFTITKVDDDTFTYTVSGSPTSPATGTIKVKRLDGATGRLEAVTSWENADGTGDILSQVKFWYDGWGNVSRAYQSHGGTVDDDGQGTDTPCVQYAYDDGAVDGEAKYVRLKYVEYPDGSRVHYTYAGTDVDAVLSRLTEIVPANPSYPDDPDTTAGHEYAQYTYLGAGTIVAVAHPAVDGGLTLSYDSGHDYPGWDRFGRVIHQTWKVGQSTVDSYGYAYDGNSNRTERTNALNEDLDETYTYDGLDRLVDTDRGGSAFQDWTLDALGNWAGFNNQGTSQTRTHDAANQLTDISGSWIDPIYDAAGNMISGPKPGAETTEYKYVYDAWNRLVQVTDDQDVVIATYRYDGLGRRIQKLLGPDPEDPTATYDYFYDESWQVVEVRLDGDPDPLDQYVWDVRYIDAPVVRFHDGNTDGDLDGGSQEGDNMLYYTTDANFNVTALVDAETGGVVERYMYDPYGKATVCEEDWTPREGNASAVANDVLYCGYRWDFETGLYQVRRRYYQPTLGRWTGRDLIVYVDGLNLYEYVASSPLGSVDAYGLNLKDFTDCDEDQKKGLVEAGELLEKRLAEILSQFQQRDASTVVRRFAIAKGRSYQRPYLQQAQYSSYQRDMTVKLKKMMQALKDGVAVECECDCGEDTPAYVWGGFKNTPLQFTFGKVHICPGFFDTSRSPQDRAKTLLHELSHLAANTKDYAGNWGTASSADLGRAADDAFFFEEFFDRSVEAVENNEILPAIYPVP